MTDEPRKPGRPVELEGAVRVELYLDAATLARLEGIREREGLRSRSAVVRWLSAPREQ